MSGLTDASSPPTPGPEPTPLRADAALVDPAAEALLDRERALLSDLEAALRTAGSEDDTLRRLADLRRHLGEGFLVVVVGEFNAGKSSALNALFGEGVMEEGPVPTTDRITILRHGERSETHRRGEYVTERTVPAPLLRGLTLVDTPGTNSIVREHQALTEDFIPRADLVLFVTSFDRPLSESERQFLEFIRGGWGRQLVVVLNKADLAASPADLEQVIGHVRDGFERLLDLAPRVFPVSARQARAAKGGGFNEREWAASGFAELEAFLTEALTGRDRLALKLTAPLEAADRLLGGLAERLDARRAVLDADARALDALEADFAAEAEALEADTAHHLGEVEAVLGAMERRGTRFLDDTIRLSGLRLLRDRDAFKEEFVRQVLRDSEREVEAAMGQAVDALLRRVLALWNRAYAFAAEQAQRTPKPAGPGAAPPQSFLYDREATFEDVRREARRHVERYDLREEARRLLENARNAATLFAGTQAAAVGIGAVVGVVVAASALDVTGGLIAAGALSVAGFWLLPRERRKAVREFEDRVAELRRDLRAGLDGAFAEEAREALGAVRALVQPVADLVEREREALAELNGQHTTLTEEATAIRRDVRARYGEAEV